MRKGGKNFGAGADAQCVGQWVFDIGHGVIKNSPCVGGIASGGSFLCSRKIWFLK